MMNLLVTPFHRVPWRGDRSCPVGVLLALGLGLAVYDVAQAQANPPRESAEAQSAQPGTARDRDQVIAALGRLAPRYRQWVQSVAGLISQAELEYFLDLDQDYRRDAFMEAFWDVRDPDPRTPVNELRRRWQDSLSSASGIPYGDPRFVAFLLNGPPGGFSLPDGRVVDRCFSRSRELEIWFYGRDRAQRRFVVIFFKPGVGAPYEVYRFGGRLRPIQRTQGLPTTDIRSLCADELLNYALAEISITGDYERLVESLLSPPQPSLEWLATFSANTTDVPAGAGTFDINVNLGFPSRNQSRTAVQVLLGVPLTEAPGRRFEDVLFHNFLLTGEILRDGDLFESFHYRFEGPTPDGAEEIPLGFTRFLRPGPVELRILLEDVFTGRYSQVVQALDVPSPEGRPSVETRPLPGSAPTGAVGERPTLRLVPPPGRVHAGMVRFRAQARGELDRVTFYLDDKPVLSKANPPYSVELNLGSTPTAHRVRVVGTAGGEEVATDQVWLNQGAQRFRVRMIEPRPGGIYPGSLTTRVEVQTPDGSAPERLELWVNDQLIVTLDEPPYARSLRIQGTDLAAVRAVAYLADGSSAEDAVLVNTGGFLATVEVALVELRVLVLDGDGQRVEGLTKDAFQVFEDGVLQEIERFEARATAPLQVALLLDRSASMDPHLRSVAEAARSFAGTVLSVPDDRVAVLSFADETRVDASFTLSLGQVERALAGLVANGGTALYDSVVQALNSFDGVSGQTALILFSDGQDEGSQLTFEQTLETARHMGVTLYALGLEEAFPDREPRRVLERLAEETGGAAFFLPDLDQLGATYDAIVEELRSRYLLAYASSSTGGPDELRVLRVEVQGRGLEVRARRGYYP